uniref:Uncharacterized protein n=1 Tax=Neobodo designis TaxID=312471 RepID=A0A7S1L8H6_NEODS
MATVTPELPQFLAEDRNKLLSAAQTIRRLEGELATLRQERDDAKEHADTLERQVEALNSTGSLRHIQYLDEALTRERAETVALRTEVIELREALDQCRASRSNADGARSDVVRTSESDGHEVAVLRSTIADLTESLERERALSKCAADMLNREYVANLTADHKREVAGLRAALLEAREQLDGTRRLLAAHGVARRGSAGAAVFKY